MLQTQIEQYNTLLRVIGGIFVVIVGVYIFAQNPVPQIRRNRAGKTSLWQDFASIFGLTIANFIMVIPYILAFFAVFKISGGDITHEGVEASSAPCSSSPDSSAAPRPGGRC